MISITIIALALALITVFIHNEFLIGIKNRLVTTKHNAQRWIVGTTVILLLLAHMLEILIFAIGYHVVKHYLLLGNILGQHAEGFSSILYFSFSSYTTLGIGDLYPTGAIRLLAGFEGLLGLLMIGWSASFLYLEMRLQWDSDE